MPDVRKIVDNMLAGYTKKEICRANGLDEKAFNKFLRKNKIKMSKKSISRQIQISVAKHHENFVQIHKDKNFKVCPFLSISVQKRKRNSNKLYTVAIRDKKHNFHKASKNICRLLKIRNKFYKENMPNRYKELRKAEFRWFIRHPFSKFIFHYVIQRLFY